MKKQILFLVMMLLSMTVSAQSTVIIDGIYYNLNSNDKTAEVTHGGYSGVIVIPSTVTKDDVEYTVTSIASNAFYNSPQLTSVTIPNSVTTIKDGAFARCSELTSVYIGTGLENIGEYIFEECNKLKTLEINSNALVSKNYTSEEKNVSCLIWGASVEEIVLGEDVTSIGDYAFSGGRMESIKMSDNLISIGNKAFWQCRLNSIEFSNNLAYIGEWAFTACFPLPSVTIPESVKCIDLMAFQWCNALTKVVVNSNEVVARENDQFYTLTSCFGKQVEEYVLGEDVKKIAYIAFAESDKLTSVTISSNLTCVDDSAFHKCTSLTDVYCYAEQVPKTGKDVFLSSNYTNAILHVPAASVEAYKNAEQWKDFGTIIALTDDDTTLPTVVEGRIWNVVSIHPVEPPESDTIPDYYQDIKGRWGVGWPHTYELKGDTIMCGVPYKKLFFDGKFISGLREEDGRVYECYEDGHPELMVFDFNLQPGDIFKDEVNDMDQMQVKQVSTYNFNGTNRRCMDIWAYVEGQEIIDGLVDYWIEGIGCMNGPHSPFWWDATSGSSLLLSCYDGDECIFTIEDLKRYTNPSSCPDDNHPHAIDLGLPSGTKWACCNVGASTPEGYGGYYAWGETEEKDYYSSSTYKHYDDSSSTYHDLGSDIAGTQYDVAHVKWGGSWVMPSKDQNQELIENCNYEWITVNDVMGAQFTGPSGGTIFLPAAGNRTAGDLYYAGSCGYNWSSTLEPSFTQEPSYSDRAYRLYFNSDNAYWSYGNYRDSGHTVRPIIGGTNDINLPESPSDKASHTIYNIYGMKVADNIERANYLPPGIYIANGKKIVIK